MTIELAVDSMAHGGHAVARHEGRVVFVRHALPGEVVQARITEGRDSDSFWRADAVAVLEASDHRIAPHWDDAGPGKVGAAEFQHATVEYQRELKRQVIRDALERFAQVDFTGTVTGLDNQGWHWRTRVDVVADADGKAAMRGYRSHDLHTLTSLPLATQEVENEALSGRWEPGARVHIAGDSRGVVAHTTGAPSATGRRSLTYPCTIAGHAYEFKVPLGGFWQVHYGAAVHLAERVLELTGAAAAVADLYGGVGLFALPLAHRGTDVVTVEGSETASRAAKRNLHAYPHARIVHSDVAAAVSQGHLAGMSTVILDPPRTGAGRAVMEALAASECSRLVYVACDPVALARDIATARRHGFEVAAVEGWDLFPMTHHVETIAVLARD